MHAQLDIPGGRIAGKPCGHEQSQKTPHNRHRGAHERRIEEVAFDPCVRRVRLDRDLEDEPEQREEVHPRPWPAHLVAQLEAKNFSQLHCTTAASWLSRRGDESGRAASNTRWCPVIV